MAPYQRRPLPERPGGEPVAASDVTYEQLMSPLSCPVDPPPAPRPDYQRTLTEGRLLNTYIEPVPSDRPRENLALRNHPFLPCGTQDSKRSLCDSGMPSRLSSRNYASMYSFDSQDLQSVSQQQEQLLNVTMVTTHSVGDLTEFTAVSEVTQKPLGPWASRGALDLWPSSIEVEPESGEESCDSAERGFLEASGDEPADTSNSNSTDSCDQLSTRHNFTVSFKVNTSRSTATLLQLSAILQHLLRLTVLVSSISSKGA